MYDKIRKTLKQIETENGFDILFACESGSRAWGFTSPDSDYDVRFIYAQSVEWYLQIDEQRDTFDKMLPDDIDASGWDLRKTLRLFADCNLPLYEWLGSPVIYKEASNQLKELISLIPDFFNPKKAMFHYLNMAKKVADSYLLSTEVNVKKLFYIIRPLFCCKWIELYNTMPPTAFSDMVDKQFINSCLTEEINKSLNVKAGLNEGEKINISPELYDWLNEELIRSEHTAHEIVPRKQTSRDKLNAIFRKIVLV